MKTVHINSIMRWITVLIAALSVVSCGGGGHDDSAVGNVVGANRSIPDNAFTATLTGVQEVPQSTSSAIGGATAILDPNTRLLKVTVATAGMTGLAVNVHESPRGLAGPVVFPLAETLPGSGVWTAQVTLTEAQVGALRSGNYYVSVRSAAHPGGEIRGQILPQLSTPAESGAGGVGTTAAGSSVATVFRNALTGTQVVPSVATSATAIVVTAIDHLAKTLTVAVNTSGIAGTEAHIHEAAPGVNGPIVFPLAQTAGGSGIWFAKASLSDAQLRSLMDGNYYVDVHSAAFLEGELRGQIAQLHRRTHLKDCRFGGFGFDDCTFDGVGFFIGLGLGGFGADGFDTPSPGFDGFGIAEPGFDGVGLGNGGAAGSPTDGGAPGFDTPAPGIFF